jgi:hypothetical protein
VAEGRNEDKSKLSVYGTGNQQCDWKGDSDKERKRKEREYKDERS